MSTNKTPNYNLHSWLPQDEFHVTEINENFTALDQAVKAEAAALSQQMAAKADKTALGQKAAMITGTYVGAGTSLHIDLGLRPKAVLIAAYIGYMTSIRHHGLAVEGYTFGNGILFDDTGFTVKDSGSSSRTFSLLDNGITFGYIALF